MPIKKAAPTSGTKNVTTKKAAKSAVSAKSVLRAPIYATDAQSFWLSDGSILNSLVALRDALKGMKKAVYDHHVTGNKNDFAEWVSVVLSDRECSDDLRNAKTPAAARLVVVQHLKRYQV